MTSYTRGRTWPTAAWTTSHKTLHARQLGLLQNDVARLECLARSMRTRSTSYVENLSGGTNQLKIACRKNIFSLEALPQRVWTTNEHFDNKCRMQAKRSFGEENCAAPSLGLE
jgi:hypothetical protein